MTINSDTQVIENKISSHHGGQWHGNIWLLSGTRQRRVFRNTVPQATKTTDSNSVENSEDIEQESPVENGR